MTTDEAKQQLDRVFVAYPSYREWLRQTARPNDTYDAWCRMLSACDLSDVVAIVDEIERGEREPTSRYEKPDSLARNIVSEARIRRGRRSDTERQFTKYHEAAR